jgi:hypothetical protein
VRRLLHAFIDYHSIAPSGNCPFNPVLTALGRYPQPQAGGFFESVIDRFTPDPGISVDALNELVDIISGVLARYETYVIVNDEDFPVQALPKEYLRK